MLVFVLVFGAFLAHAKRHSTLRDYPWGPDIEPKPIVLSTTHQPPTTDTPVHIWPMGRIPYVDDPILLEDEDQAVALNNARMDLQVRTCIKFVKRRNEQDYVFFTDLGLETECWNMFERNKGHVAVNAGPACLAPMKWPYRPKQVFSECDIEYVNHLYKCPRSRRKQSPICPAGHTIMSLPEIPVRSFETSTPRSKKSNKHGQRNKCDRNGSRPKKKKDYKPHNWPYLERGEYSEQQRVKRPLTSVTVRARGKHTTVYPIAIYTTDESPNTSPLPSTPTTTPSTTTSTTESTTTTTTTTTESTTTSTTTTTSSTTTATTTTSPPPTTTTPSEIESTTDFPDFTDIETPEPLVRPKPMKQQVMGAKKHLVLKNRTHEFSGASFWRGSPKNGHLEKEQQTTETHYVGSCGSPCNYTGGLTSLRRSYNDKIGITDHFYTTDIQEQQAKIKEGYLLQSPMGFVGQTSVDPRCTCLRPLYRLYNDFLKDHLLTTAEHEKEMAERILGYKLEKVIGFCTKEAGCVSKKSWGGLGEDVMDTDIKLVDIKQTGALNLDN